MKVDKLDSKQVPQVIVLGVLTVGVLGYAVFSIAFGGPKRTPPSPESTAAGASSPAAASGAAANAAETGAPVSVTANKAPELTLPSQFNPDPFKTSAKAVGVVSTPPVASVPKPAATASAIRGGVSLPDVYTQRAMGGGAPPPTTTAVVPTPKPAKPEVLVTGTSMVSGMNLAILEVGQDHRVVQVGDLVADGYRVKKIQLDGVMFANKKESFFRHIGVKEEPKKDTETEGARPEL